FTMNTTWSIGLFGLMDAHAAGVASAVGVVRDVDKVGDCALAVPPGLGELVPDSTLPLTEHEASATRPSAKSASPTRLRATCGRSGCRTGSPVRCHPVVPSR